MTSTLVNWSHSLSQLVSRPTPTADSRYLKYAAAVSAAGLGIAAIATMIPAEPEMIIEKTFRGNSTQVLEFLKDVNNFYQMGTKTAFTMHSPFVREQKNDSEIVYTIKMPPSSEDKVCVRTLGVDNFSDNFDINGCRIQIHWIIIQHGEQVVIRVHEEIQKGFYSYGYFLMSKKQISRKLEDIKKRFESFQ
eukprot:TRINITY_DN4624_c0_g1_i1.p1 TRINITY_DN4624_c0_g1~~TRINITY_DN4624_c0_g1_i1.p1  ORF type:complete len:191 (-),score=51.21 TRINITY_DN4624_c0_g1_i1:29-601(-)